MMIVLKSAEVPKVQCISFFFPVLPPSPYYLEKGHWPGQSHLSVLMRSGWQVSYLSDSHMSFFFTRSISWAVIPPASKISTQGNSWFPLHLKNHHGFNKIKKKWVHNMLTFYWVSARTVVGWAGRKPESTHLSKYKSLWHLMAIL